MNGDGYQPVSAVGTTAAVVSVVLWCTPPATSGEPAGNNDLETRCRRRWWEPGTSCKLSVGEHEPVTWLESESPSQLTSVSGDCCTSHASLSVNLCTTLQHDWTQSCMQLTMNYITAKQIHMKCISVLLYGCECWDWCSDKQFFFSIDNVLKQYENNWMHNPPGKQNSTKKGYMVCTCSKVGKSNDY